MPLQVGNAFVLANDYALLKMDPEPRVEVSYVEDKQGFSEDVVRNCLISLICFLLLQGHFMGLLMGWF